MFSRSGNSFLIFLLSYVRVTSKIQFNFRYKRYLKVPMILSYGFSQFLQYLCFRGQGIHCWHSQWAAVFGWPRKSKSTSGTGGTRRYWWLCFIDFWNVFTVYVFEVKESIPRSMEFQSLGPCTRKWLYGNVSMLAKEFSCMLIWNFCSKYAPKRLVSDYFISQKSFSFWGTSSPRPPTKFYTPTKFNNSVTPNNY